MKPKSRNSRRRYSGRRRNERLQSRAAIVLIILFIIAVVAGTVFLGNYLKRKADISIENRHETTADSKEGMEDTAIESTSILSDIRPPEKIEAEYVPLENIDTVGSETEAVTLVMRDLKGKLNYSSSVVAALGGQDKENGLKSADEIFTGLAEKNIYISVLVGHTRHDMENNAISNVFHTFESAILTELTLSGANEVIICGIGEADGIKIDALCEFSKLTRQIGDNNTPLGILLPYSFFLREDARELCAKLAEYFEIIAVDYTDAVSSEDQSITEVISSRIDAMQLYFSRYSVRIVLDSDSDEYANIKQTVIDRAIYSIQSVSASDISGEIVSDAGNDDNTKSD
ncbi:MAG: hypothetical protein U0M06_10730 [Clostridia bacterium]|nr:hypothetical protein [Clostridia bacterium]